MELRDREETMSIKETPDAPTRKNSIGTPEGIRRLPRLGSHFTFNRANMEMEMNPSRNYQRMVR